VRPLRTVRRAELHAYLERRGQEFRRDATNADTALLRNRVRHVLVPLLQRRFPQFSVESLAALNDSACDVVRMVEQALDDAWEGLLVQAGRDKVVLDADACAALPRPVLKAAFDRALCLLVAGPAPALRAEHYRRLAALPQDPVGATVGLPTGLSARRDHGCVCLLAEARPEALPPRSLSVPGRVAVPEARLVIACERVAPPAAPAEAADPDTVFVDADCVCDAADSPGAALVVRGRRAGDRFRPLGAPGHQTVKQFLIDAGVPRHRRSVLPLVTTEGGDIVWVVGRRLAHPFRLRPDTQRALRLTAHPHPQP
jgi:tRNA(Ile)-lysidine synthase